MHDNDSNFIQSDLDMQLLTQMQIEDHLRRLGGGPSLAEIEAERKANNFIRFLLVAIFGGMLLLLLLAWAFGALG